MLSFWNEDFVKDDLITISPSDRGYSLGDGVFDTMLSLDGVLIDAEAHFERLLHDAIIMDITHEWTMESLRATGEHLLVRNDISTDEWVLRTQISRGIGPRGLMPPQQNRTQLSMRLFHAPPASHGTVTAIISQTVRRNEHSPLSRIKSTSYADNILALIEARDLGAMDAILLNTEGLVTCTTSANLFIREGDRWFTPPVSDGVLPGITRGKIMAEKNAAADSITLERLTGATEIFQCNSVIGIRKIMLQA